MLAGREENVGDGLKDYVGKGGIGAPDPPVGRPPSPLWRPEFMLDN